MASTAHDTHDRAEPREGDHVVGTPRSTHDTTLDSSEARPGAESSRGGTSPPYVPYREQHGCGLRGVTRSRATSSNVAVPTAGAGGTVSTEARDAHSVHTRVSSTPAESRKRILRSSSASGTTTPRQASTAMPSNREDEQGERQDSCRAPGTITEEGPESPLHQTEETAARATARV